RGNAAVPVQHHRDHQDAVEGGVTALAQGLAVLRRDYAGIDVEAAGRHLVDDLHPAGGQADHVAVARGDRLGDLQVLGQGDVLQQVPPLTVGRHGDLGPRPLVHALELIAAGVAGYVDARMVAFGVEAHATIGEVVLQVADRHLVAGDDPRGEDAGVP